MKVLIADDDSVSRLILRRAVEMLGHDCLVARDGAEAWSLFQGAEVDVVISDWMMPGMDGVELCHRVREHNLTASAYTYFVFLSALGEKQHFLVAMQEGADDYLTKPLDRVDLQVRLNVAERVMSLYHQVGAQKSELERLNGQLFEQAHRDPLTLLGNRLRLEEDLAVLQARVERYGHTYCMALCDVDHFKRYNDTYGHLAGDAVLREVADTIVARCRRGDVAYRYGGEEFLIVLPEQTLKNAAVASNHLREAVQGLALIHEPNQPIGVVTISVGVAGLSRGAHLSADTLLKRADDALYQAKEHGRNRVMVHQGESGAVSPTYAFG